MAKGTGLPVPSRVAERAATSYIISTDGCWITTYKLGVTGYGRISWRASDHKKHGSNVHRAAFQYWNGQPCGAENEVDHLCHDPATCDGGVDCPHRGCVRPEHLGESTHRENTMRSNSLTALGAQQTCCSNCSGPFTEYDRGGKRFRACLPCRAANLRKHRAARSAVN